MFFLVFRHSFFSAKPLKKDTPVRPLLLTHHLDAEAKALSESNLTILDHQVVANVRTTLLQQGITGVP
jgi:hypothetical protein